MVQQELQGSWEPAIDCRPYYCSNGNKPSEAAVSITSALKWKC